MGALIWAYLVPVKLKATVETPVQDAAVAAPALAATVQVGEEQAGPAKDKEA